MKFIIQAHKCKNRSRIIPWEFNLIAFRFIFPSSDYRRRIMLAVCFLAALVSGFALVKAALAQSTAKLEGRALVTALQQGGFNIYFRHAATDWSQNDQVKKRGDWVSCDAGRMRQLSAAGRQTAGAIGAAMRSLKIPVGQIFASPYCRTVQTARYMQLGIVETTTVILNMRVAEYFGGRGAIATRTRRLLSLDPRAGTNTVLVAHGNVLVTATDVYPQEAEAIVFRPQGEDGFTFAARISPRQWERLATEYGDR